MHRSGFVHFFFFPFVCYFGVALVLVSPSLDPEVQLQLPSDISVVVVLRFHYRGPQERRCGRISHGRLALNACIHRGVAFRRVPVAPTGRLCALRPLSGVCYPVIACVASRQLGGCFAASSPPRVSLEEIFVYAFAVIASCVPVFL